MNTGIIASGISAATPYELGVNSAYDANNPNNSTSVPADGTSLSSITDLGRNGNNWTQSTGTAQPILKRNIINGQNVFRFSGNQYMTCPASANNNYTSGSSLTIVAIASTSNTSTVGRIFTKSNSGSGAAGYTAGKNLALSRFSSIGGQDADTSSNQWTLNTFGAYSYVYHSGLIDFYTNGSLVQSVAVAPPGSSTWQLILGANFNLSELWYGDIVALYVFFRQLSSWELYLINTYCRKRIGL